MSQKLILGSRLSTVERLIKAYDEHEEEIAFLEQELAAEDGSPHQNLTSREGSTASLQEFSRAKVTRGH